MSKLRNDCFSAIGKENRYAPFQKFEEANYNICYQRFLCGKMGKKTSFFLSLWDNGKGVEMILKNWIDFIRKHTSIFIILLVSQILALLCIFLFLACFKTTYMKLMIMTTHGR